MTEIIGRREGGRYTLDDATGEVVRVSGDGLAVADMDISGAFANIATAPADDTPALDAVPAEVVQTSARKGVDK